MRKNLLVGANRPGTVLHNEHMKRLKDETLMSLLSYPPDRSEPAAEFISGLLAPLTCAGVAAACFFPLLAQIQTYPVTSKALIYSLGAARSMDREKSFPTQTNHPTLLST